MLCHQATRIYTLDRNGRGVGLQRRMNSPKAHSLGEPNRAPWLKECCVEELHVLDETKRGRRAPELQV